MVIHELQSFRSCTMFQRYTLARSPVNKVLKFTTWLFHFDVYCDRPVYFPRCSKELGSNHNKDIHYTDLNQDFENNAEEMIYM